MDKKVELRIPSDGFLPPPHTSLGVHQAGTRDKPLRTSAGEGRWFHNLQGLLFKSLYFLNC